MNIAILSLLSQPISKQAVGGTEIFTNQLVEGLVKQGHTISLYCSTGSQTAAQNHIYICDPHLPKETVANIQLVYPYTLLQIKTLMSDIETKKYDIVHVNFYKTFLMSAFAKDLKIPIVFTVHGDYFNYPEMYEVYSKIGQSANEHYIYVSNNALARGLVKQNASIIHNGIDMADFPPSFLGNQQELLWLSRLDPVKGAVEAMEIARKTKRPLRLSGFVDRKKFPDYYEQQVKPHLNENIIYEDSGTPGHKQQLYQQSKAFLFPIQWEEPFGLVFLEAMASGTPIITYAKGAAPEIIKDGVTGFLVNSADTDIRGEWIIKKTGLEGLQEAVEQLYSLSADDYIAMRKACRAHVEMNFSTKIMAEKYEQMYQKVLRS